MDVPCTAEWLVGAGGAGRTTRATGAARATAGARRGVLVTVAIAATAGNGRGDCGCAKYGSANIGSRQGAGGSARSTGCARCCASLRGCFRSRSSRGRSGLGKGLADHGRHQNDCKQLLHENSILVVIRAHLNTTLPENERDDPDSRSVTAIKLVAMIVR